jgi:hypothetical protein
MAGVRVQIKGIRELQSRLDYLEDLGPVMRDLALTAVGEQKKLAPVRTGNLRRTIHVGHISPRSAETIASAIYAAHVEFGTQPHEIRPRNRKALRWKVQGGYRFARRVNHPGTRAQPYMVPGAERAISAVGLKDQVIARWNAGA